MSAKTKVSLFLDPEVARLLMVVAAESGKDRSTIVTEWIRYVASQSTAARHSHQED